jgi:hypothetical protein
MGDLDMDTQSKIAVEIYSSYAPKDEKHIIELEKHLRPLEKDGKITIWHKRITLSGTDLALEIDSHLNSSRIILLFVSPDFMDSDYYQGIEVKRAMERHEVGEARVIPVILRPAPWEYTPFSGLLPLPRRGIPITSFKNRDEAYVQIAREINRVADDFLKPPPIEDPVLRDSVTIVLAERVSDEQREAAKYIIEALRVLSLHQKKVNELKKVHNMLHELELVLELLAETIQREVQRKVEERKESLDIGSINIHWQLVPPKIEDLTYFAVKKMMSLEEKDTSFTTNNVKMIGPKWVTEPLSLQDDFEATLGEANTEKRALPGSIEDLARKFLFNCRRHLRDIDRRLLETVDQVDQLSEQIIRSINHGQN